MNRLLKHLAVITAMLAAPLLSPAQNAGQQEKMSKEEIEHYKQRIKQLVQFFEYSLNILGNDTLPASDKESVITSSYLKIFRDEKVQVEDDLDERKTITNKNIPAYLQDVDYFFKDVKFTYDILDISPNLDDKSRPYFRVTLNRNLKGVTIDDRTVNNNKKRFIEVNLDVKRKDLKIVSVYTNQINEQEETRKWWNSLSDEWQQMLLGAAELKDTSGTDFLKPVLQIKELDLSSYPAINNLQPIQELTNITRLNISGTAVSDILPLLDLTNLEYLDLNHTPVRNIQPLKYSLKLKELIADHTATDNLEPLAGLVNLEKLVIANSAVTSLGPIAGLRKLKHLNCSFTGIADITPLTDLTEITHLDFSNSKVADTGPLKNLVNTEHLNASSTGITSVEALGNLKKLKWLNISGTPVNTLAALNPLTSLEKLYCDNTAVPKEEILKFLNSHPSALVVYESETTSNWWGSLSAEWKKFFLSAIKAEGEPGKEQLAAMARLTEVDVTGNRGITDLAPLTSLINLKKLAAANTSVKDLKPLEKLSTLEYLDISGTEVSSLSPVSRIKTLAKLKCNNTKIKSEQVNRFKAENPKCVVIFNTEYLGKWWSGLSAEWKSAFQRQFGIKDTPGEDQLHQMMYKDSLNIDNKKITSLSPLNEFVSLRVLILNQTLVTNLSELKPFPGLQRLQCSNSPLAKLDGIEKQAGLRVVDFSNTALQETEKLAQLKELVSINLGGTKVKNLKTLGAMPSLKAVNCSNTRISSLKPLQNNKSLVYLACFNTRIRKGKIERFRKENPSCELRYY